MSEYLPPDFLDCLRHAADEDESAGHHLQAQYIQQAAAEIERLRTALTTARAEGAAQMREGAAKKCDHRSGEAKSERDELRHTDPEGSSYYLWAEQTAAACATAIRALPIPDAQPSSAVEWRTMESAPRDGTVIMMYVRSSDATEIGFWEKDEELADGGTWLDSGETPTHWMPLPPPPSITP